MTTITAATKPPTTATDVERTRVRAVAAITDLWLAYRDLAAEGGLVSDIREANACADQLLALAAAVAGVGGSDGVK